MNDTTYGESLHFLIGEFMNLVDACRQKGVQFDETDGFDLNDCAETINWYLALIGFDEERIADFWTGEEQLTSS